MVVDSVVLTHVAAYALGVITPFVLIGAWLVLSDPPRSTEEIEGRPYIGGEFVSRTTGEVFGHISEAKQHAREKQGWTPDGPGDDTWRQGFTVRASDEEVEA